MDSFVEVTDVVFFWPGRCNDAAVDAGHHMHDHMRLHGILETGHVSRWLIQKISAYYLNVTSRYVQQSQFEI
jgi:hypothetical protein